MSYRVKVRKIDDNPILRVISAPTCARHASVKE
jgi:hypothetical protein